jgi:hypothetical protein
MRLEGTAYKGDSRLAMTTVEIPETSESFSHNLDQALLQLCKTLSLPLPLWLKKNTREFATFRQTTFSPDQYTEPVNFDQFYIKLID